MWNCPTCRRVFEKTNQVHTCRTTPLEHHLKNKEIAKKLFETLNSRINANVGSCKIVSIPCCIHLFGRYDFMAVLPKNDRLEIRFALNRVLQSSRLKMSVPLSHKYFKNCIDIRTEEEIDKELIAVLKEAYHLKDET